MQLNFLENEIKLQYASDLYITKKRQVNCMQLTDFFGSQAQMFCFAWFSLKHEDNHVH